jgi:hypothetical protein
MSRPLRINLEQGIHHVTARGGERRLLVRDDRDREKWLELLDRVMHPGQGQLLPLDVFLIRFLR